jgi:hypothetical protein
MVLVVTYMSSIGICLDFETKDVQRNGGQRFKANGPEWVFQNAQGQTS